MATPETIAAQPGNHETQPQSVGVEAVSLPEGQQVPAIEFVRQALALSVKEGNYTNVEAAKKLNSWDPANPVHPGFFR